MKPKVRRPNPRAPLPTMTEAEKTSNMQFWNGILKGQGLGVKLRKLPRKRAWKAEKLRRRRDARARPPGT